MKTQFKNRLFWLSFIPQRLLGVSLFLFLFQLFNPITFDFTVVLFTAGKSLVIFTVTWLTVPRVKREKLAFSLGTNKYILFTISGIICDFLWVTYEVLFS